MHQINAIDVSISRFFQVFGVNLYSGFLSKNLNFRFSRLSGHPDTDIPSTQ